MSNSSQQPLPLPIRQKLAELRSLISRLIATEGAVALASWLIGSFLLFGLIDYLPTRFGANESPKFVRIAMLVMIATGSLWILAHFFWNRWLVRWSDASLALAIEKHHPEFQSTLITTVQANQPTYPTKKKQTKDPNDQDLLDIDHPNRPGMLELATRKAIERIQNIDVKSLIRFTHLQTELALFGCLIALCAAGWLLSPQLLQHWTKRLFGLSDQPWPRRTSLALIGVELEIPSFTNNPKREKYVIPFRDGKAAVPKGSSLRLRSTAKDLLAPPYDQCSFLYRDRAGNRGRATMLSYSTDNPKEFSLDGPPLEAISDSLWFSLNGGDARLSNLMLDTVDAPIPLSTEIDVQYPEYLQRSTKTTWGNERLPYRNGMRLPQATQVALWIRANRPIAKCDIQRSPSNNLQPSDNTPTDNHTPNEFTLNFDPPTTEFAVPLGFLDQNLFLELRLWDDQGLCSTRVQQLVIASIVDTPPEIDLILQGIGSAITENATIPIRSKIKDDYDLNQAWVESIIDDTPPTKTNLQVTPQGNADIDIDLKAMRDAGQTVPNTGSTLALLVAASDYMNTTNSNSTNSLTIDSSPHIGRSTPIQLSVVTVDQFLVLIDRREAAMRRRLEQIISELGQLRDLLLLTNKNNQASSTNNPNTDDSSQNNSDDTSDGATQESEPQRRARILLLRTQQASTQTSKSESELKGVLNEISNLVAELINNRIDSKDRRERLEEKIKIPLADLLESQWQPFSSNIADLEPIAPKATPEEFSKKIEQAIAQNNELIASLNAILADMIELQDLNEIIERVRGLLDNQSKLLDNAKEEQKKSVLDLLK